MCTCVHVSVDLDMCVEIGFAVATSQEAQGLSTTTEEGLMTQRSNSLLHICSVA